MELDAAILNESAARIALLNSRDARMQAAVDALWELLSSGGVSWVGFYLGQQGAGQRDQLQLGPRRDKPACSPIGLHGACGRCFLSQRILVVDDVAQLGNDYIACDPRDRSELVIPCFDNQRRCWGVLDLDSHKLGHFSASDGEAVQAFLLASRISY